MACSTCSSNVSPALSGIPAHFVTVNGAMIAPDEIAREMPHHPAATPTESWHNAAQALVLKALLCERAAALSLAPQPQTDPAGRCETDEEALFRAVIEADVQVPQADEDACRRYYTNNAEAFTSPTLIEASHILLAFKCEGTRGAPRARAEAILREVLATPTAFATFALEHSDCPSRMTGGSLGQLSGGDTVAEFESALSPLQVGLIHDALIETRYGYHIVRLDRRVHAQALPFEAVAASIGRFLNARVQRVAMRQYAQRLLGVARVSGLDVAENTGPLLQ